MKSRMQTVIAIALGFATLGMPFASQNGPTPVCPGTTPCVHHKNLPVVAPQNGPGPVCPSSTPCAR